GEHGELAGLRADEADLDGAARSGTAGSGGRCGGLLERAGAARQAARGRDARRAEETASAQEAVALVAHRVIVGPAGGGGLALPGASLDHQRIPPQARPTKRRRAGIMPDGARSLDLPPG